ncbi:cytochrome c nitrite reductase small subunit [bacterium I07]|nr:cytochrome c nitrite reductase small subunit [bacterium I07]
MIHLLEKIIKSVKWWWIPVMLGVFAGVSAFTFYYAEGGSYFADDPRACKNCHIMREQFDAWNRSSHKSVATCNSCHTPKNVVGKYAVKAVNGWNHSVAFTTGIFHEPLQIKGFNRTVVENNCIRCHHEVLNRMIKNSRNETPDCTSCHGNVGHKTRK